MLSSLHPGAGSYAYYAIGLVGLFARRAHTPTTYCRVLPFSLFALLLGCRKHRTWSILRVGSFGLVCSTCSSDRAYFFGEIGEKLVTMIGSTLLIIGQ